MRWPLCDFEMGCVCIEISTCFCNSMYCAIKINDKECDKEFYNLYFYEDAKQGRELYPSPISILSLTIALKIVKIKPRTNPRKPDSIDVTHCRPHLVYHGM